MHVTVKWFDGKYPSFNLNIASAEGKDDFLSIKGCRIVNGSDGEFLSMPATKNEQSGKYWNHAWASEQFAAHVLKIAKESRPQQQAPKESKKPELYDIDDIPF